MLLLSRSWMVVVAVGLAIACAACQSETAEEPAIGKRDPTNADRPAGSPSTSHADAAADAPKPQEPPPPQTIPKVVLSEALGATCLVNVGQTIPNAELPESAGKLHALHSLYGQKLTVISFWTIGATTRSRLVAAAALRDLMKDVAVPFAEKGVQVIAVNVGDSVAAVRQELDETDATFPCLLDPQGQFYAKIARDGQMPRTFLLNASGKILWFDVEYSRPSRRDLLLSLRVALGEL